jgi:hypothetical protein
MAVEPKKAPHMALIRPMLLVLVGCVLNNVYLEGIVT